MATIMTTENICGCGPVELKTTLLPAPERMKVLQNLAAKGDFFAEEEVIRVLQQDPSDVVRHEAAFILGDWKERCPNETRSRSLEALIRACRDQSILVRHEAALSLAAWKCERAIETLATLCHDSAPEVRGSALHALVEML